MTAVELCKNAAAAATEMDWIRLTVLTRVCVRTLLCSIRNELASPEQHHEVSVDTINDLPQTPIIRIVNVVPHHASMHGNRVENVVASHLLTQVNALIILLRAEVLALHFCLMIKFLDQIDLRMQFLALQLVCLTKTEASKNWVDRNCGDCWLALSSTSCYNEAILFVSSGVLH